MFDHSWSWCDSFGCFCSGGSAHIKSNNSKGSRRYSLREPFSLFPAYQFLVAPYNDLPADLVALLADSFQFQNHFNQEFFFAQLHETRFLGFRINCRSFFQPIKHKRCPSALLTTAATMIIFFVVRVALIRAVVPVCLICAVVWIVLICVMVQLFFAVGVARYSVFFTHFSILHSH